VAIPGKDNFFGKRFVMRKLPAVEQARAIMLEGTEWGVWKWLTEKRRVRDLADKARAALDEAEMKTKLTWSDDLKIAYNQVVTENGNAKRTHDKAASKSKADKPAAGPKIDPKILVAVQRIQEADDHAYNAHEDAEEAFVEAEKKMSTSMARDAARKALEAYDLHESAIRKAEALAR
jgi:hypothetical protein